MHRVMFSLAVQNIRPIDLSRSAFQLSNFKLSTLRSVFYTYLFYVQATTYQEQAMDQLSYMY